MTSMDPLGRVCVASTLRGCLSIVRQRRASLGRVFEPGLRVCGATQRRDKGGRAQRVGEVASKAGETRSKSE
jgi:hypothetical protein